MMSVQSPVKTCALKNCQQPMFNLQFTFEVYIPTFTVQLNHKTTQANIQCF